MKDSDSKTNSDDQQKNPQQVPANPQKTPTTMKIKYLKNSLDRDDEELRKRLED